MSLLTSSGLGSRRQLGTLSGAMNREARSLARKGVPPGEMYMAASKQKLLERSQRGSSIGSADDDMNSDAYSARMARAARTTANADMQPGSVLGGVSQRPALPNSGYRTMEQRGGAPAGGAPAGGAPAGGAPAGGAPAGGAPQAAEAGVPTGRPEVPATKSPKSERDSFSGLTSNQRSVLGQLYMEGGDREAALAEINADRVAGGEAPVRMSSLRSTMEEFEEGRKQQRKALLKQKGREYADRTGVPDPAKVSEPPSSNAEVSLEESPEQKANRERKERKVLRDQRNKETTSALSSYSREMRSFEKTLESNRRRREFNSQLLRRRRDGGGGW